MNVYLNRFYFNFGFDEFHFSKSDPDSYRGHVLAYFSVKVSNIIATAQIFDEDLEFDDDAIRFAQVAQFFM